MDHAGGAQDAVDPRGADISEELLQVVRRCSNAESSKRVLDLIGWQGGELAANLSHPWILAICDCQANFLSFPPDGLCPVK